MKKLVLLTVLSLVLFSCKQKNSSEENEVTLIRGEFILIDDAGVIKGKDFIYGVEINTMAKTLAKQIKPLQREDYDMVPVVVNGVIKPNPQKGWEEIVDIKEIVGVTAPTSELPTKIKSVDDGSKDTSEEPQQEGS